MLTEVWLREFSLPSGSAVAYVILVWPLLMVSIENYETLRQMPTGPPSMHQRWRTLLFLHFRCDPAEIQALLPEGLEVDTFDGSAWVGLVPFRMEGVRPVSLPGLPGLSAFPETNVRTYVHSKGVPGVWFFSLDAANPVACALARRFFSLPYHFARMGVAEDGDHITYEGIRPDLKTGSTITCRVGMHLPPTEQGSLEYFLIERYLLYTVRNGNLCSGRVFHKPYPLRVASVEGVEENLIQSAGITPQDFVHAVYSPGVDVLVYGLIGVGG